MRGKYEGDRSTVKLYAWPVAIGILSLAVAAALVGQALWADWSLVDILLAFLVWGGGVALAAAATVLIGRRRREQHSAVEEATTGVADSEIAARATVGLFQGIELPSSPTSYPSAAAARPSERVLGSTAAYIVPVAGEVLRGVVRRAVSQSSGLVLGHIDDEEAHIGRRTTLHFGVVWIVLEFSAVPAGTNINARSRSYADLGGGTRELQLVLDGIQGQIDLLALPKRMARAARTTEGPRVAVKATFEPEDAGEGAKSVRLPRHRRPRPQQ